MSKHEHPPGNGNGVLLRAEHLTKLYPDGQVNALVDVTLEIRRGEYVAVMGPSGSGKSTLLNMLGALDRPTSGETYFEGRPMSQIPNWNRLRAQKIGFVFQSFYLLPVLSAMENVQVPMFESPLPASARAQRAVELLEEVGLGHRIHHPPEKLSVGERQRVAIARALANEPVILLADEPTGNLDSKSAADVFDLFAALHRQQGMTIVLITHDDALGRRAERIVRMQDGQVRSDMPSPGPQAAGAPACGSATPAAVVGPPVGLRVVPGVSSRRPKSILPPFAVPDRG
ncbi:MAG: ABC transporter ATP-binding protein [Thermoguttaceae bacterium]|jgi:putative ABC transport system ATP-binding protein